MGGHGRSHDFISGSHVSIILQRFFEKMLKMHYSSIFIKISNKPCVRFSRVWKKNIMFWNFLENFRKISKVFLRKLFKMHFSQNLIKDELIFCAFGRETQIVG